jgi:hypothetical protein
MIIDTGIMTEKQWDIVWRAMNEALTGGNHLASVLINRLGCAEKDFPPFDSPLSPEQARSVLDGENWDLWIAWRSIMRLREALRQAGLYQ